MKGLQDGNTIAPGNSAPQVIDIFSRTVRSLVIEVTLATGVTQYYLGNIRRLQDTFLQQINVPYSSNLTVANSGKTLCSQTSIEQAYLTLLDKKGDAIIDHLPLYYWERSNSTVAYFTPKGFANLDVDWEKSYVSYPAVTQPNADNGKVLMLCVDYCCLGIAY